MDKQNEKEIDLQIKRAISDLDTESLEDLLKLARAMDSERDKEADLMQAMEKTGFICQ